MNFSRQPPSQQPHFFLTTMDATDEVNALDKSSDSEGICADYASKTDEPPEMLTSTFDFGDVRIPCQKITRTVSSRSSGLSMSMVTYKSPSPTRIPTLMSKSFSVTCAKKALDESCGSREQLCDDFSDVSADAKRLLQRSRERKKHRANSFDPRCLFALNYSSPMAMSTSQRAPSRTRLLNRPQWIRHLPTSSTNALQTSTVWPQQRCNNIASQQHEPTNSIYCRVRRNKEGGLQRPKPWQVVRLGRLRCSTCSKCRHANRLRRLAISSAKMLVDVDGILQKLEIQNSSAAHLQAQHDTSR